MIDQKLNRLKAILSAMERVVIAYSGGVDSTFLVKIAYDVLGDRAVAVTADSPTYPEEEFETARELARQIGVRHEVIVSEELKDPNFAKNPADRCYHCKMELFCKLKEVADRYGAKYILYGANYDDTGDFRPGMQAADEVGARAPLKEVGMTKDQIRWFSKDLGLPTWDKPATACLSSRFPYGTEITEKKLRTVGQAEQFLRSLGFRQLRVRHHDQIARIEVPEEDIPRLLQEKLRAQVIERFNELGYPYVTLDLKGYRTGSLNEVLRTDQKRVHI